MRWELESDLDMFAARARPLLESDIVNNVVATVLSGLIAGHSDAAPPFLAVGMDGAGAVAAVTMRIAPWPMLCTPFDPGGADALMERWLERDPDLPGVNASRETAHGVSAAWARRTEGRHPMPDRHGHALLPDGGRSAATRAWTSGPGTPRGPRGGGAVVERVRHREPRDRRRTRHPGRPSSTGRIARQQLWLWEDEGPPVSMVAVNPPVAGVVRIGPVYTPVDARRRGYASSAVAAASRHALNASAHTCMLFTDLANPTSNKIYADVGYRRFGEWEETEFTRAPGKPCP